MTETVRPRRFLAAAVLLVFAAQVRAQRDWLPLRTVAGYSPIVFDAARGRLIRFGVEPDRPALLEWRGEWLHRDATPGPSAREKAALVYDAARQNVVLFGGSVSFGSIWFTDTWLWDGIRWTLANPTHAPSRRAAPMMADDPLRQRVVLFGGVDPAGYAGLGAETWLWDGSDWSRPVLATEPAARKDAGFAFDRLAGQLVLVGGEGITGPVLDTWRWDGAQWQLVGAAPTGANICSMAFDEARGRLVLAATDYFGSGTWVHEWSGQGWVQVASGTTQASYAPTALAYDGVLGRVVRHTANGRLEAWDGVRWQEIDTGVPPMTGAALTSDYMTGAIHLVAADDIQSTTWRWDSHKWTRLRHPTYIGRGPCMLASDPTRGCLVLSEYDYVLATNRTWEWHGVDWQPVVTALAPSAREGCAMAFDSAGGRVLLFGGRSRTAILDETWTYDGTNWSLQQPAHRPPARGSSGVATDLYRARIVLFGGSDTFVSLGDTWEWDGNDWQQRPGLGPAAREAPACGFDLQTGRVLLTGGIGNQGQLDDTWEWDGSTWRQVLTATRLRGAVAMAYEQAHGRPLLFAFPSTTFVFDFATRAAATVVGRGCAASLGVLGHGGDVPMLGTHAFALEVLHAAPGAPCLIAVAGAQQAVPLGGGCTSYLAAPWSDVFLAVANAAGVAQVPIAVPDDSALMGAVSFTQAAALDPAGPLGGVSVANALQLTLGQ